MPMQEKQLRQLLNSPVSISSSLLANGWKPFFSTISPAPQTFVFFWFQSSNKISLNVNTFQSILQRKSLIIFDVLGRTIQEVCLRLASQQKY